VSNNNYNHRATTINNIINNKDNSIVWNPRYFPYFFAPQIPLYDIFGVVLFLILHCYL